MIFKPQNIWKFHATQQMVEEWNRFQMSGRKFPVIFFNIHVVGKINQNNDNPLIWSIGIGRVHDVTKLTFLNSAKNFIYHTEPLLYTDFTKLSDGKIGQMQMISEIVEEGISKHGACLRMDYEVWSFDSKTDITETKEKEIWHFNSNDRGNNTVTLQLPYTNGELFRLILTAKSAHSSTYITVKEIQFWEKSSVNDDCKGGYELENHLIRNEFIKSPEFSLQSSSEYFCFDFDYYFMNDGRHDNQNYLTLYLFESNSTENGKKIWVTPILNTDFWHHTYVEISRPSKSFRLNFIADSDGGLMAVKNFHLKYDHCPKNVNICDFETSICGWKSSWEGGITIRRTLAFYAGTPKGIDHTTLTPYGYVLFGKYCSVHHVSNATLTSPVIDKFSGQKCFQFWICINDGPVEYLKLSLHQLSDDNNTTNIWKLNATQQMAKEWNRFQVTLNSAESSTTRLQFHLNYTGRGSIRFDDFGLFSHKCPEKISCNFLLNTCGWKNQLNDDNQLTWNIGIGRVHDVTQLTFLNSTKKFIYHTKPLLYTDFTKLPDGKIGQMKIISEIVDDGIPKSGACIRLNYEVWSFDSKTDKFFINYQTFVGKNETMEKEIWRFNSNDRGSNHANIYIPYNNGKIFRLIIVAKSAHSSTYITIDDINYETTFSHCNKIITSSSTTTESTWPTSWSHTPSSTTIRSSKQSLNCDFEQGKFLFMAIIIRTFSSQGHFAASSTIDDWTPFMKAKNPFDKGTKFCFEFYFYAAYKSKLNLILGNQHKNHTLFLGYESDSLEWRRTMIEFEVDDHYDSFIFIGSVRSIVAIDDISAVESSCDYITHNHDFCDFEMNSKCMFENVYNQYSEYWSIMTASSIDLQMVDHTTHTSDGHVYGFIFDSSTSVKSSIVQTKSLSYQSPYCIRFSYYLTDDVTLYYKTSTDLEKSIWHVSGTTNGLWFTHQHNIDAQLIQAKYHLQFGIKNDGNKQKGMAFIDDVTIYPKSCDPSIRCDFENGNTCTLEPILPTSTKISAEKALELTKRANYTLLAIDYLTGYTDELFHVYSPLQQHNGFVPFDHTKGSRYGKYLIIQVFRGWRGIIITERYSLSKQQRSLCLTMAVYSSQSVILEVYQGDSSILDEGMKIWELTYNTNSWKEFEILANARNDKTEDIFFFIVATGLIGRAYIGIDDFEIKDHCTNPSNIITTTTNPSSSSTTTQIPNGYFDCQINGHRSLIPSSKVCDYHKDCTNNMDEKYCGSYDNYSFRFRFTDQTPDHQPNDYYFRSSITASGTGQNNYQLSLLITPLIHQSYLGCELKFYYRFNTNVTNFQMAKHQPFNIYLYLDNPGIRTKIWQISAINPLPENEWNEIYIKLNRIVHPFYLEFEAHPFTAMRQHGYHSLHDIKFDYCEPPEPAKNIAEECENRFHCRNGVCINEEFVCDFEDDCGDNSDEYNCDEKLRFSFENGYQSWAETYLPHVNNWTLQRANSIGNLRESPTFDHTTGFVGGSYLFTSSTKDVPISHAIIDSPAFTITNGYDQCDIRMFTMKNSRNSTISFKLWNLNTGGIKTLSIFDSYRGLAFYPNWITVHSESNDYTYKLLIEVLLNRTDDNFLDPYVAVDDILFYKGCTLIDHPIHNLTTEKPCIGLVYEQQCGDCNFNNQTMCGWKTGNMNGDNIPYQLYVANETPENLPKKDANNSSNGGYVGAYKRTIVNARLQSSIMGPQINAPTTEICSIEFSYQSNMFTTISILVNNRLLRSITKRKTDWITIRADIGRQQSPFNIFIHTKTFQLRHFIHILNVVNDYYMIIDNIRMIDCNPNNDHNHNDTKPIQIEKLNCNFEQDWCGWIVPGSDSSDDTWIRTNSPLTEPGEDHTELIIPRPHNYGNWLSTFSTSEKFSTNQLRSSGPIKPNGKEKFCLTFWHYYFGIQLASFRVFIYNYNHRSNLTIWMRVIPNIRYWQQAQVEFESDSEFYLFFEALVSITTIVGIDDIQLINKECPIQNVEYCDFEVNNCDWEIKPENQIKRSGGGIIPDHTTETSFGRYLTDKTQKIGSTVSLYKDLKNLPYFIINDQDERELCFNLYYYFSTKTPPLDPKSSISISVFRGNYIEKLTNITINDAYNEKSINIWSLLSVNFMAIKENVLIVRIERNDQQTEILLDDFIIRPTSCKEQGTCDFEYDMCGWHNDWKESLSHKQTIFWVRLQPTNRFAKKDGMSYDHTLRSRKGNYLVLPVEMHSRLTGTVTLISPYMKHKSSSESICFQMYYFAKSSDAKIGIIAMKIQMINLETGQTVKEFITNATISLQWTLFKQTFDNVPNIYSFRILISNVQHIQSDIGIDDIQIEQKSCPNPSSKTTLRPTTSIPDSEKIADCNFEQTNCKWKYSNDVWKIISFVNEIRHNMYAPPTDHTYLSKYGNYLLFTNQSTTNKDEYKLISPDFSNDKDRCLLLWYYNDGEDPFYLSFYYHLNVNDQTKLIGRYGSTMETRRWQLIKIDIPYVDNGSKKQSRINIQINYRPSSPKFFSIFAIDDIKVRPGHCGHQYNYVYTFTKGIENLEIQQLQPINSHKLAVRIYPNNEDHFENVPGFDHTTYTSNGYYFLFKNSPQINNIANQYFIDTLQMRNIPRQYFDFKICVRFAYQSRGNAEFYIYQLPNEMELVGDWRFSRPIWHQQNPRSFWTIEEFNIGANYISKLIFYMSKKGQDDSFVALDDITVLLNPCTAPIDCNFDMGHYCTYTSYQDSDVNYHFEVFQAPAIDLEWPGPTYDHTIKSNDGGYLFLTAYRSVSHIEPLHAKIVSGVRKISKNNNVGCLEMWTVINSNDASLKVTIIRYGKKWNDSNRKILAFEMKNVEQREWTRILYTLNKTILDGTDEVQILIEGSLGSNRMSAIAIDDIVLSDGSCDNKGLLCENGIAIDQDRICNFINDCPSGLDEMGCGNCNFESDMCGWLDTDKIQGINLPWQRVGVNELQLINSNAPKMDGSSKTNGHYVIMRPHGPLKTDEGRSEMAINYKLRPFYLKNSFKTCEIHFDYYLHTISDYFLKVSFGHEPSQLSTFYTLTHEGQGGWRQARALVGQVLSSFFIEFDAFQQQINPSTTIFALDNIKFVNCSRPKPLPANHVCPKQGILCNSTRLCITIDEICDNVNDCDDMDDERNCYRYRLCSFNSLYDCGLTIPLDNQTRVLWQQSNGNLHRTDRQIGYEPLIDNTQRNGNGNYFLLVPKPEWNQPLIHADFYTPIFRTQTTNTNDLNDNSCHFRFFWYMHSDFDKISMERLEVYVQELTDDMKNSTGSLISKLFLRGQYDQQQRWNKQVILHKSHRPFQFIIRGILNYEKTRIAIDDLSYGLYCIHQTIPTNPPPTIGPITTGNPPYIHNNHHHHGAWAAIMVPILLIIGIAFGFYGYRRSNGQNRLNRSFVTMFMSKSDTVVLAADQ
ncbi:hypothetical protein DERP_013092 [Dermatophagoides pteronyssinus]|uniref:MAM domain-containing protein n=1 Tax=Dermatophagoides pteronyssinus TaxID=6956 RepID=A0ABQ8J5I1_DERPT|nr:hypothetical protein DERP_013092 [Dermatophagoides pteronyssinus]